VETKGLMRFVLAYFLILLSVSSLYAICPVGDITHDCKVDIFDIAALGEQWLGGVGTDADLVGADGVDLADLAVIAANWQEKIPPVVINEFMASNVAAHSTIVDGTAVYPDWIELYNHTEDTVLLDGWYLTDNTGNPDKWRFPNGFSVPAGGYKIIFASGKTQAENPGNYPYQDSSGYYHTNFELKSDGESLAIVESDGETIAHQYIDFPSQISNMSYGLSQESEVPVPLNTTFAYKVPADASDEAAWMQETFDDSSWTTAAMSIGFGFGSGETFIVIYGFRRG